MKKSNRAPLWNPFFDQSALLETTHLYIYIVYINIYCIYIYILYIYIYMYMNHLTAVREHFSPARTARLLRAAPELLIMVKGMMLDLQVVPKKGPHPCGSTSDSTFFPNKKKVCRKIGICCILVFARFVIYSIYIYIYVYCIQYILHRIYIINTICNINIDNNLYFLYIIYIL